MSYNTLGDEELALRLQTLEIEERRRQNQRQAQEDEEFARRLIAQEMQQINNTRPVNNQVSVQSNNILPQTVILQIGKKTHVRLQHTETGNYIGEGVWTTYLSDNSMSFELVSSPGKFLRVTRDGSVEFCNVRHGDDTAVFKLELLAGGKMYLQCKGIISQFGSKSYLTLTRAGVLRGDGTRGSSSQWLLLAQVSSNQSTVNPAPSAISPADQYSLPPAPPDRPLTASTAVNSNGYSSIPNNDYNDYTPVQTTAHVTNNNNRNSYFENVNPMINSNTQSQQAVVTPVSPSDLYALPTSSTINNNIPKVTASTVSSTNIPDPNMSPDQLLTWLSTTITGQQYLVKPGLVSARRLLGDGNLIKILHRPDWTKVADRYVDLTKLNIPYNDEIASRWLTDSSMIDFFDTGAITISQMVSSDDIHNAKRIINYWLTAQSNSKNITTNQVIHLSGAIASDFDILKLFYESPVFQVVQRLLGEGDVQRVSVADIVVIPPTLLSTESSSLGQRWQIDGFTNKGDHSPYTLLVGIALSDFDEIDEGNLSIYPGSHLSLQQDFINEIKYKRDIYSNTSPNPLKKDLGQPHQINLVTGDVVIMTQKLAYTIADNNTSDNKLMAFFRVSHVDHNVLKEPALEFPWIEYKGVNVLDKRSSIKSNEVVIRDDYQIVNNPITRNNNNLFDNMEVKGTVVSSEYNSRFL